MAYAVAPLADVLVFCALIAAGTSLRSSSISAFAVGVAFNWLLTVRAGAKATKRPWRAHLELLLVALLALFLRGGALGLLTQTWDWPPQLAILFAVALGLAVTVPGYSYALSAAESRAASQSFAIGVIVYSVVLRLLYAGSVELMPEETYYWNYSQHLDLGYLDHPPMVAWLIRLGTLVFGQQSSACAPARCAAEPSPPGSCTDWRATSSGKPARSPLCCWRKRCRSSSCRDSS